MKVQNSEYREWKRKPSPLKLKYLDNYVAGRRILDIGSGLGFYSEYLANKGFEVVAIDQEKYDNSPKSYSLIQCRAEDIDQDIPVKADSFDTVTMFDILEHVRDDHLLLERVKGICRNRIILSVPNKDDGYLPRYNLTFKHHKDKTHYREYTREEIKRILEEHGFTVEVLNLEGSVSPLVFGEFLKPDAFTLFYKVVIHFLNKIGLFKTPKADIFVVGTKK